MEEVRKSLKECNLKVTPQRVAILSYLLGTKEHPNAETIYNKVVEDYPNISFATVYKTLDSFKKVNLVQELNVGEDSYRYDADISHHPHFICKECHSIIDIYNNDVYEYVCNIKDEKIKMVDGYMLYLHGTCKDCE